jgi:branched-chain amino acid transport system substrate-binding protein
MEGSAIATFISKRGYKKIWIAAGDYEWGHTIMNFSLNKLKELAPDTKVLGESWPKLGETDFTPYISSILAAKPDFLFGVLNGADLINFTKQAKPYGLYEKMHASGVYDLNILRALGSEMIEGAITWNRGEFFCIDTPEMNSFVETFRKAFGGEYPTVYATFAYETVYCVKQAMEKAKSTNKEKVIDALEGMEFTSPRGKLYFRKYDHQASGSNYVGFTTKNPKYPFYVLKDFMAVPGEETWLHVEEIKKLRGGK